MTYLLCVEWDAKPYTHTHSLLPFPSPPLPFSLEARPFKPARRSGERCKLPSGAWGEFGVLYNCEKVAGSNHFEYSEVHVLQHNDQNLALAIMQYRFHLLRSVAQGGGGAGSAPSKSATAVAFLGFRMFLQTSDSIRLATILYFFCIWLKCD